MYCLCIPPVTSTLSELIAMQLIMELCPVRFCRKLPSGNFHCLILSGDAVANAYLKKQAENISVIEIFKYTLVIWVNNEDCIQNMIRVGKGFSALNPHDPN